MTDIRYMYKQIQIQMKHRCKSLGNDWKGIKIELKPTFALERSGYRLGFLRLFPIGNQWNESLLSLKCIFGVYLCF